MQSSSDKLTKEEYNAEPVVYCARCLSLKIRDGGFTDYCDSCGYIVVTEGSIEAWEELYEERYGEKFINK